MNKKDQNPNAFLDAIIEHMQLKNDAALARLAKVPPPILSKIRHFRLPVTPATLLKIHDATGLSIAQLREMLYPTGATD